MIVSRRHGIVFIHIWKTGGTSIATALENHLSLRASVGEMLRRRIAARWNVLFRRPVLGKHAYAVDISQRLGAAYEQYFSFAFVRNPWDWLVSWYTFVRRSSASPDTG